MNEPRLLPHARAAGAAWWPVGTAGYVVIEGWSLWDALYMTVTTVATVGYREVHPLSPAGQAFTLVLIVVGVSTALYAFSAFAAVVVEGGWPKYVEQWRYVRMINHLSDHYVVCGYGRIGSIVASEFTRQKTPFVIVDRNPDEVAEANQRGHLAVEGDASREETLKRLGIDRARGLVAAVGTDAENVYAVLTARVMKSDLFIIARAEGEESISKLKKAGADRVISPYRIGARPDRADGAAAGRRRFRGDRDELGQSGAVDRGNPDRERLAAGRAPAVRSDPAR